MAFSIRSIVLLSGGLDSCVAATEALRLSPKEVAFLHISYGQLTAARERTAFDQIGDYFGIECRLAVDASYLSVIGGSSLTEDSVPMIPAEGIPSTYVPFRNANLLAIATAWAETVQASKIYLGTHEPGCPYPDCSTNFFKAYQEAIDVGTRLNSSIVIETPLIGLHKGEIVKRGIELGAPLHLTWSCYTNEDSPCDTCHSCAQRRSGFRTAGVEDPLLEVRT